jgi:PAS domain S-box-containing protein
MTVDLGPDVIGLRGVLRDLVALSAIPAVWVGKEPSAIAAELAELVATSLYLDFVFVRLHDPNANAAVEITRGTAGPALTEWLHHHLTEGGHLSRKQIVPSMDNDTREGRGIVIPVGMNAERGLVAAWCDRPDFPSEIDQLLLSVAAAHAATAFRMARLLDDHQRAETALRDSERELRKAGDELEMRVAERTAELRRSEAYLAEAQRLTHTGSGAFNETTTLYWSEETYRIWGFDPIQGLPDREALWQRIHPDDRERVHEETQEALRRQRDYAVDFRIVLPDRTIKYVEATGHHLFSARGDLLEIVGSIVDVTERKRAQEEHERLRRLELDLAHVNRVSVMGALASSLAHEVTQPIASARNNARAALNFLDRRSPNLREVKEALDCVVGDADRAGDIIDRVRDHVKKAPPRKGRFDLVNAISQVILLAGSEIAKNGVTTQTRLPEGVLPVQGDRVQVQQVILNLILNAVEAMAAVDLGARELSISAERNPTSGVIVAVRDSGPGIDPENLERIFEAFYTTKSKGLGMGLSICRSIIETHGGRLWADANEPRGAAFQFTLPVADCPN